MRYKVLSKQFNTDRCFVCGMLNDSGTKAEFYNCMREDGEQVLITKITPNEVHQSYPNRMHGGVISALLDESIGRSIQYAHPDIWAVTMHLNVTFRKPVPLDQILYIESKITNIGSRAFEGEGKIFIGDTTLANATAKFFRVPFEEAFKSEKLNDKNWFLVKENLPEYFDL